MIFCELLRPLRIDLPLSNELLNSSRSLLVVPRTRFECRPRLQRISAFLHRLLVDFPENILIELIYKSYTFLIINPTSVSALVSLEPLFRGTFPRVSALPECAGVGKCFPQRRTGKILGQIFSK